MPAQIAPRGGRKYQAWCETCSDGVNSTKTGADEWAEEHNTEYHSSESE